MSDARRWRERRSSADGAGPREIGGVRWWFGPGLGPETASAWVARALAASEAAASQLDPDARGFELKRGRRKSLYRLEPLGAGRAGHLLKVNRYPGGRRRRSKARHELALAAALADRGLPTPVPLAAGERRNPSGRTEACYLLVAIVPDAIDVREALADTALPPRRRRALAYALGDLARRLHDAGLHQADFQPNNFLVRWLGDAPELFVIDFERARLGGRVPDRLRHRALAKLDRELGRAPTSLRLRFLHGYCREGRTELRARWRALEREAPALARRDRAHLQRSATIPGRRFQALRISGFSGIARPGLDPRRLRRAIARAGQAGATVSGDPLDADWSVRLDGGGVFRARRALARALLLAARGLAPTPLALLCGREHSLLVLERGERAVQAHEVRRNRSVEAACRVLERRLNAYGRCLAPLSDSDVALEPTGPGGVRATLLGIESFALRSRFARPPEPRFGPGLRRRSGGPDEPVGPAR